MGIDQINGTMLTTFDVWSAQEQVNGDGILMYPPQNPTQGPLSSIRLENIRDGTDQSLSLLLVSTATASTTESCA
jgi:hypothetical protein